MGENKRITRWIQILLLAILFTISAPVLSQDTQEHPLCRINRIFCNEYILVNQASGEDPYPYEELITSFHDVFGGPDRVICLVHDDESSECMTVADYITVYEDIYGSELTRVALLELLRSLDEETLDILLGTGNLQTLLLCQGGVQAEAIDTGVLTQGTDPSATTLSAEIMNALIQSCEDGLDNGFDILDYGLSAGGGNDSAYTSLVDNTRMRVNESLDNCTGAPGNTPAAGPAVKIALFLLEEIVVGAVEEFFSQIGNALFDPERHFSREQGQQFRINGQSIRHCLGNSNCEFGWNMADRVCQQPRCQPVEQESSEEQDESEQSNSSQVETQPDQCFSDELTCTDDCESRRAEWERFEEECESRDWQSYTCKSFVYKMNACPDPATILPHPDRDFQCIRPATDAELQAEAFVRACEEQQGLWVTTVRVVGDTGDERYQISCEELLPEQINPENVLQTVYERQCLYMLDDSGVCTGNVVDIITGNVQPEPLPVQFGALPGG